MKIKQKQPVRGEVYLCQFDPARGSEQAGTRPAVIVERTAFSSVAAKRHVLGAASFDIDKLIEICLENDAAMVGVFGSVARGEDTSASDIDLMVKFSRRKSLLDIVKLERELSNVLGRKVDLLTEAAISPYLRDRILGELQVIYEN